MKKSRTRKERLTVDEATRQAERLFRAAVRRYERDVRVLCNPEVERAAKSLIKSGEMVSQAMDVLAEPVCRHLRLRERKRNADTLCSTLDDVGTLKDADESSPTMLEHVLEDLPDRESLDDWLVRDGRRVLDEFRRVGKLDPKSEEYRRIRECDGVRNPRRDEEQMPQRSPAPPQPPRKLAGTERQVLARAERLLSRAARMCGESASVLCTREVKRAADKAETARVLVKEAVESTGALVLARLGRERDSLLSISEETFVDKTAREAIQMLGRAAFFGPYALEVELPSRSTMERVLKEDAREVLTELARILALPEDSTELGNLRRALEPPRSPPSDVPECVTAVKALPGYKIHVVFSDGVEGEYSMKRFKMLRDERFFRRVFVSDTGAVCWPPEIDFAPEVMHDAIGKASGKPFKRWIPVTKWTP